MERIEKVKGKWEYCNSFICEENHSSGFSWPQRNYRCCFCKRQFNSAQALGGHMNVHRRDRARLKHLASWVLESSTPTFLSNPNPSFLQCPYIRSPLTPFSSSSFEQKKSMVEIECYPQHYPFSSTSEDLPKKKNEDVSLDLEMGCKDPKEFLDLELRLGYF